MNIAAQVTALAVIEQLTPMQLFTPGTLDPLLDKIREEARFEAEKLDISTESNRKAIASLAYKIARSKTFIDEQGKKSVADKKAEIKAVDAERSRVWKELESLQEEVRKPLTDWEEADKERIAGHESALSFIETSASNCQQLWQSLSLSVMQENLQRVENDSRNWEEFSVRAAGVKALAANQIKQAIEQRDKYDAEQAELVRLRTEAAAREQKEREERIAREATEKAEREAKAKADVAAAAAKAEQDRIQREKEEAEQRARDAEAKRVQSHQFALGKLCSYAQWINEQGQKYNSVEISQRLIFATSFFDRDWEEFTLEAGALFAQIKTAYEVAIDAAKEREAEQYRIAAEQSSAKEAARIEAERRAAIEAERKRVEAKELQEKAEVEARERNKKHCAAINRKAADALIASGITEEQAKAVITLIAKGEVPNVSISY